MKKKLLNAYEEFFGEAIKAYDEKQKRTDRKYGLVNEYITSLENSKNGEKLFYEIVVQIGDMTDSGCDTRDGKVCADILNEYALAFQERNPNLKLINIVLRLDEKTPHLHIDYVPVATGYSQGLSLRNSLFKALENQNYSNEKRNKYQNSLFSWQKSDREYLKDISKQYGIETTVLGDKRDNMDLETYKVHAKLNSVKKELNEVIRKTEELKEQTDYYEDRLAGIDDIRYGAFGVKQAEKDNKALQYENNKLKEEKAKLHEENKNLREASSYWQLLYKGIMTYTDDVLHELLNYDIMSPGVMEVIRTLKIEKVLQMHPYAITKPKDENGRWQTYVNTENGR